jgi:hypothetical protein
LIEGGGGCKIVIRDFPNGTILQSSPVFSSASHSNTAVVIDDDMVYGQAHDGYLQAYNETTDSEIWRIHIGPGGSYSTDGNTMELYDNHLYLQSKDHIIYKINISDGSETANLSLDGGSGAKAHMLIDYENDRLYALGQSKYYCIDLPSFSEIWNVSIVTNGGQDTRGGPILVNDSFSGQYLTIFTTYPQTYTYAVDFNGSIVWSWTTKTIRHHPAYSPNTGLIYLSDATGYTNTPVPGNLYAVYVNNGTTKWLSHGDGSSAFSRPLTISGDYLIMHTDNKASTDYMIVISASTGDMLSRVSANSNRGYWCFPNALSGGYVATGGAYGGSEQPALDIYHIGDGDWVDYYPLHGNVNHTGYVPNGLTSLGFKTETWESRKVNDTPLVNNTVNTIGFDFSSYNLPLNFTWNILLEQSDGQYVWGDNRTVRVLPGNLSPVISNPLPANNSVNVPKSLSQLSVEITDPESNLFNWTIETNPNIGSNSDTLDNNGSKTCSVSGLDYNTTYTWYVNATDTGSDRWTNETYSFTTEGPPAPWWNTNWLYRISIVIDHDKVSENLTNFPVLIDISYANLSTKAQSDGDDFVFTDYNGNKLNHEIEYYDNSSGHLIVWVNVTSLSATVDTVLYMYYGNPGCGNQDNIPGTWRSEFVMVHHLDETSGTHYDSTSYGNNGTAQSSVDQNVTGKIDGADEFDDTANAFIDVGVDTSMDIYGPNSDFSIFLWVNRDNLDNLDGFFSSGSSGANGIFFGPNSADRNDLKFMSPGNTVQISSNVDCINDYDWHLVGVTGDRDGNMNLWVDGSSVKSQSIAGTAGENWNRVDDTYKIGTDRSEGNPMDGQLDEVWVYDGLLSNGWVLTCYYNQNDPGSFYDTGIEETQQPINQPPIANYTYAPVNPTTEDIIYFNSTSYDPDGHIVNWTWDLGDGNYSYVENTTHQYIVAGLYTVNLTVMDNASSFGYIEKIVNVSPSIISWEARLNLFGPDNVNDFIVFGEFSDASDGQDSYDVPKPPTPSEPYVYGWFDANLSIPYNKLWKDYRLYPDTYKVWDMYVRWEDSGSGNITINWNTSDVNASEYSYVTLKDMSTGSNTDMLLESNYTYFTTNGLVRYFQIICSIEPMEYNYNVLLVEEWNLVSIPVNESVHKDNITVNYLGVNYTWQQAVDNGTVLGFIYGWNATNQNYVSTDTLQPGEGYWMYAYSDCTLWITSNTSNNDNFITDLQEEWNLVGLPYDTSVAKDNLTVSYNGTDYTWQQAVDNGTILGFIYGWNTTSQNYESTDTLQPGEGYWMYAYYECLLRRL